MRVLVLFLGGTISMTGSTTGRRGGRGQLAPDLTGADLLDRLPSLDHIEVDAVDVAHVDSSALTFETCLETLGRADEAVRRGEADGVVVVQGTDTLEETAYLWDLLWRHPHAFVVTGAMRSPDMPGADGPANLLAAVEVAGSTAGRDLGVLVTVGDEIHAARYVAKRHTSSPRAFVSPDLGPVGRMEEGVPVLGARLPRREVLATPVRLPEIALVRASLDDSPRLYRAAADLSEGLVVEGFGAGQVRPAVAEVLGKAAARIPVALASRTGAGAVAVRTYGGPGSGSDLRSRGVLPTGRLGALKSRVLLRVLLGASRSPSREALVAALEHHGA